MFVIKFVLSFKHCGILIPYYMSGGNSVGDFTMSKDRRKILAAIGTY